MQAPTIDEEFQTAVTSYEVYYESSVGNSGSAPHSSLTDLTFTIPNPVLSATYTVRVTAFNIGGESGDSNTASKGKYVTTYVC